MNGRLFSIGLALMLGAGYSLTALSQVKPATLVKQRQAAMTLQSKYLWGQLRPMAQGKIPYDANVVARNTTYLDALTKMAWDGFAPKLVAVSKSGDEAAVKAQILAVDKACGSCHESFREKQ